MRKSQSVASVAGTVLAVAFFSCAAFSRGIENCTQGDTDSYLVGLIFGTPVALAAVGAFWLSRSTTGWPAYAQAGVTAVVALALALVLVPWVASTTIAGHHPCGALYDEYVPYGRVIDRFVPLLYLALLSLVLGAALIPLVSRRGRRAG
jgi:uncharacterized protein (DUF983 family)